MAYDHEEQQQLDTVKAWWTRYGNLITWVLIAALTAYAGWSFWRYYQRNQSTQAAQLYEGLQKLVLQKDSAKILRAASDMQEKFPQTGYASMAGLVAAKSAFEVNDLKNAKSQLQWVIAHGSDEEYKALAKVRVAGILLDEKSYEEGLKMLSGSFPAAFASVVADRRGDLLMAQNNRAEARVAYQSALEKMDAKNPGRQLIELKLDSVGGQPVKKVNP